MTAATCITCRDDVQTVMRVSFCACPPAHFLGPWTEPRVVDYCDRCEVEVVETAPATRVCECGAEPRLNDVESALARGRRYLVQVRNRAEWRWDLIVATHELSAARRTALNWADRRPRIWDRVERREVTR